MAQITLNSTGVASSGALVLQSNGTTTAVTISTAQVATLEKDAVVNGLTVGRGAGAVSTNTAVGASALAANTTGSVNSAFGYQAGYSLTTGTFNNFFGQNSAYYQTTGSYNIAIGQGALQGISGQSNTGSNNTAVGNNALLNNTTASNNTAVGYQAGYTNTTGTGNTFLGNQAGLAVTTSNGQTFIGSGAGASKTTGGNNTFVGVSAGGSATTGTGNTFIGVNDATSGAGFAVTTGSKNTIIGGYSGNQGGLDIRTASNYIVLSDGDGNPNLYLDNNKDLFVPKVYVSTTASAANVFVTSAGQMIRSNPSSARFKENITDWSGNGLEEILKLKPRTFTYKASHYSQPERSFLGLIAEEVATVSSYLVDYENEDGTGQIENVRYANIVVPLVKAIQELKADLDATKAELAALKGTA